MEYTDEEWIIAVATLEQWQLSAARPNRIAWLSDLVRLEITLWNLVDRRLRDEHGLPLAYFWPLHEVGASGRDHLRVGELAAALRLTVGGTSKVVDRIAARGLLRREADTLDRRASRVVLTEAGRATLAAASVTYNAALAVALDAALSPEEQHEMLRLTRQLLATAGSATPA